MMLPGREMRAQTLSPRLQRLAAVGFSFRIDAGPYGGAVMYVCYGAEDVVASLPLGLFSTKELLDVVETKCETHRWIKARAHPVLARLDVEVKP